MQLGIVTPVLTRLPRTHAALGGRRGSRRGRATRRRGRAARLRPRHVQRARRRSHRGRRDRAARRYWDPLADVRVPRGAHDDDPVRDVRARARLPPPARDREALRHARPRLRRAPDPRRRRRLAARRSSTLLGAEFDDRGARADDAIRALRASLRPTRAVVPRHALRLPRASSSTRARVQTDVPIWIGGRTARSLRRAVELGDGWAPFGLTVAEMATMLDRARATDAWAARTTPTRDRAPARASPSTRSATPTARRPRSQRSPTIGATALERPLRPPLPRPLLRAARRPPRRTHPLDPDRFGVSTTRYSKAY